MLKAIPGFNGYYATNCGKITKKYSKTEFLVQSVDKRQGYPRVCIYINGGSKVIKVHRLIALAWLPNPENKFTVNHKDGNKLNNHIDNLEWNTYSENIQHAFKIGLSTSHNSGIKWKKKIYNTETGIIYNSVLEASQKEKIKRSTLSMMLTNKNPNKTKLIYL